MRIKGTRYLDLRGRKRERGRENQEYAVAYCLRHYDTNRKVAGSRSDETNESIYLELTQSLTEMGS
jgi:hypothetical protein